MSRSLDTFAQEDLAAEWNIDLSKLEQKDSNAIVHDPSSSVCGRWVGLAGNGPVYSVQFVILFRKYRLQQEQAHRQRVQIPRFRLDVFGIVLCLL